MQTGGLPSKAMSPDTGTQTEVPPLNAGPPYTGMPTPFSVGNTGPPPAGQGVGAPEGSPGAARLAAVGLVFRVLQIALAFIALIVMATLNYCEDIAIRAFSFLISAMAFQILFSIIGLSIGIFGLVRSQGVLGKNISLTVFILDFIATFIAFAGACAGAGVTTYLPNTVLIVDGVYYDYCSTCVSFCSQANAAVAMAFLAWLAHVPSMFFSSVVFYAFIA